MEKEKEKEKGIETENQNEKQSKMNELGSAERMSFPEVE